jgi:phosphoribosylformylglycinamidine cyclo-ligase
VSFGSEPSTREDKRSRRAMIDMAARPARRKRDQGPVDYESTGISSNKAYDGLSRLTTHITRTWRHQFGTGHVCLPLGHFANVVEVAGQGIAFCTDGVGSKSIIAQMLNRYDSIGVDCVAMNVNDLICVGATPISMVDYIAIERADPYVIEQIAVGLSRGATEANISISGGEIAQLPGIICGEDNGCAFDLVGAAIGQVPISKILTGSEVRDGDVIIGVRSNGIHSNGLTLAREIFFGRHRHDVSDRLSGLDVPLGEELLKPTYIYVKEALEVLGSAPGVKALAHVTSDGLGNLARMPPSVEYVIDRLPPVPRIFELIQTMGRVSDEEMFLVYNMGVGFCFIADRRSADSIVGIVNSHGKEASQIGYVRSASEKRVFVPERNLTLKSFRKSPTEYDRSFA